MFICDEKLTTQPRRSYGQTAEYDFRLLERYGVQPAAAATDADAVLEAIRQKKHGHTIRKLARIANKRIKYNYKGD